MRSIKYLPSWIKILAALLVILAPAVWMTLSVIQQPRQRCRVCMDYQGRSDCREAEAPTRQECQRTATDNACALIASGMTQTIACANTPPTSVTFD